MKRILSRIKSFSLGIQAVIIGFVIYCIVNKMVDALMKGNVIDETYTPKA